MNIFTYITELADYGTASGITDRRDRTYVINSLLAALDLTCYQAPDTMPPARPLHLILEDIISFAAGNGIIPSDSSANRDLFDTMLMGILTPAPSVVEETFRKLYSEDPVKATDRFYDLCRKTNYIRIDRIARDIKWKAPTEYGNLDITVNLSKPEKDPRDIEAAGKIQSSSYPKCLLCPENEGYRGTISHPARQNLRLIPVTLQGEEYFLQYSPYIYYNEHCIIINKDHIPMKIDRDTMAKLLDFVRLFPHYTAGSNADLPIVGGSILSHDHFQGGRYEFPMARAPMEEMFTVKGFDNITAGTVKWPMSVIRLQGDDPEDMVSCAERILNAWISYTDEDTFIYAYSEDGTRHNTITPIARRTEDLKYELDLVLRNNITTEEHPLGVFHPHAEYHHIKKENIGLIEVMGLAVLPGRLASEMEYLTEALLEGSDISSIEVIAKHAQWVSGWRDDYDLSDKDKIENAIRREIGISFARILECCGVFKRNPEGRQALGRFIGSI
ncbi:MAG: UDP-glucose--hexose-1-phosphate uridylyltransferase [Clostridiales bacterium]|nr:UDP-glucose--hexose-1-phosphate uridylyltransferase [Clostridiales bacterium]